MRVPAQVASSDSSVPPPRMCGVLQTMNRKPTIAPPTQQQNVTTKCSTSHTNSCETSPFSRKNASHHVIRIRFHPASSCHLLQPLIPSGQPLHAISVWNATVINPQTVAANMMNMIKIRG